jgi:SHS2 domain-containing protein
MDSFTILPHTADTRLSVTGETAEQLFRSSLEGLSHIQKRDFCKEQQGLYVRQDVIQIKSPDITGLLIDFLSEVLTLSHINKVVYCEVIFHKFFQTELIATIKGNKVNYFDEDVKAVTYHEAEVKKNRNNQLETVIIFDI